MRASFLGGCLITAALMTANLFADESSTVSTDDVNRIADRVDELVSQRWTEEGVTPAPLADDAEFLRRAHLDIAGKIPTIHEVWAFLADGSPDKRRQVIDQLLETPGYITNFTTKWRMVLMPEANTDAQVSFFLPSFEAWLREQLTDNVKYDAMVHELLTLELNTSQNQSEFFNAMQRGDPSPWAFYQGKQLAPENLAGATSRMFLGIRLGCAQCHDHPFDKWQQKVFWSFPAFYAGIVRQGQQNIFGTVRELTDRRELSIPGTDNFVQPVYLDGSQPRWKFRQGSRETLANWITSRDNKYFSRTAVNRMWELFFGLGLVDPVDDFGENNPPSHPELLDELAVAFVENDYDVKFLIRAITASKTYQLTSHKTHDSQQEPTLFARMAIKGMTAHQLAGSLSQATGIHVPYNQQRQFAGGALGELAQTFTGDSSSLLETQATVCKAPGVDPMNQNMSNVGRPIR